jgi:hypothetical protein
LDAIEMRPSRHEVDRAGERAFAGSHRRRSLDDLDAFEAPGIPVAHADIGVRHAHAVMEIVQRAMKAAHRRGAHRPGQVAGVESGRSVHRFERGAHALDLELLLRDDVDDGRNLAIA